MKFDQKIMGGKKFTFSFISIGLLLELGWVNEILLWLISLNQQNWVRLNRLGLNTFNLARVGLLIYTIFCRIKLTLGQIHFVEYLVFKCMFWECARKPEYSVKIHTGTRQNLQNPQRKFQSPDLNPRHQNCEVDVRTGTHCDTSKRESCLSTLGIAQQRHVIALCYFNLNEPMKCEFDRISCKFNLISS